MNSETSEFLAQFPYESQDIIKRLKDLWGMKVLVIGDTIIDQYHYCSSVGKSPKDNIIVVKYLSEESFAGGVLAAANHIAGFCDNVHLVTCLGQMDTQEDFIRRHLKKNIIPQFFYREDTATIIKRRFVEPNSLTKVFGVSFLDDYALPAQVSQQVCAYLESVIDNYDLVVVTDFGHGFLDDNIIDVMEEAKFLAVNTQTNTDNAGFNLITKYSMVDYICLDESETRLAYHAKFSKLEDLIRNISEGCDNVAITHGQYDTLVYSQGKCIWKIPVFSGGIKDTTGAGDAFFSITAPCVKAGFPMDLVGFIGNAVGALKVRTVCNRSSVEPSQLFEFITELLK